MEISTDLLAKFKKVAEGMETIPKSGWNDFHKYEYATERDVNAHVRPLLLEASLLLFPRVEGWHKPTDDITVVDMVITVVDTETGESIEVPWVGEGKDSGDKGFYKAYTGALKYFLLKTFLIETGDDPEGDNTTDKDAAAKPSKPRGQKPTSDGFDIQKYAAERGVSAYAVLKRVREIDDSVRALGDITGAHIEKLGMEGEEV